MLLDHSNYFIWKSYIKNRLEDEGLWSITMGTETLPSHPDQAEASSAVEEIKKKSRLAFYMLIKSMDDSVMFSVSALEFENNPSALWKVLQSKYQPSDLHSKFQAFKRLRHTKFNQNDPELFIDSIRNSFAELDQVGFSFDESTWMVLFLSQLPAKVADSILIKPGLGQESTDSGAIPITSCEYLFEKLRSLPIQQSTPNTDAKYQHQKPQDHHSNPINTDYSGPTKAFSEPCPKCNRRGHGIERCWVAHPELNPYHNSKNFGFAKNDPLSASSNDRKFNVNGNNDQKAKNHRTGWAPHQKTQDPNNQDQTNCQTSSEWDNSYHKDNNVNNNSKKFYNKNKEINSQSDSSHNDYNKTRDLNNKKDFFKKPFRKSFQGQGDGATPSSKWNTNANHDDQSPRWGNDNHQNDVIGNEVQTQQSSWVTNDNSVDHGKVTESAWTDNASNFEIPENPPNQWAGLGGQQ